MSSGQKVLLAKLTRSIRSDAGLEDVIDGSRGLPDMATGCRGFKREFGWSDRAAERFISVGKLAGKFDTVSNLDVDTSAQIAQRPP
jgi:hypothetical protein